MLRDLASREANGEVEGPDDHVSQARRARNIDRVPPRPTTYASRPPATIVRGHPIRPGTHLYGPYRVLVMITTRRLSSKRGTSAFPVIRNIAPYRNCLLGPPVVDQSDGIMKSMSEKSLLAASSRSEPPDSTTMMFCACPRSSTEHSRPTRPVMPCRLAASG